MNVTTVAADNRKEKNVFYAADSNHRGFHASTMGSGRGKHITTFIVVYLHTVPLQWYPKTMYETFTNYTDL